MTAPVHPSVPAAPRRCAARPPRVPAVLLLLLSLVSLVSLLALAATAAPSHAPLDLRVPVQGSSDAGGQAEEGEAGQSSARASRTASRAVRPAGRVASPRCGRRAPVRVRPVAGRPVPRALRWTVLRC
ncbi:hypothetical protein [Streptomyces genisteinicus]|uniref:Uncharacterized protein n=1 Tax=Streptomyces genisteinicus TaxID=2768068 RepID=A0A7H0I2H2_9ACTN|nr:hypothetical protein [Streptomyces genisteinicus]QNP66988.1 hypothetical protein IAG43_31495 [Streptomyces genisteinicus]